MFSQPKDRQMFWRQIISRTHSVGGEDITPNFSIACKVKTTVSGIASTFAGEGVNLFRAKTYKLTTYKTIFQMVHERLKNSINNIIYYNI